MLFTEQELTKLQFDCGSKNDRRPVYENFYFIRRSVDDALAGQLEVTG